MICNCPMKMKDSLLILLIHLFGFLLLMEGLFPYTKRLNIRSNRSCFDHLDNLSENVNSRFILLMIDALRSDYVFHQNESFHLKSIEILEKSNLCLKYELKCHSPTVTLPRLKSILTGSIPSFWDVIANYNSSEIDLDNLLSRFKEKYPEKKILFYGDDTWMKLYPKNIFSRSESLQSFFVNDFEQIDFNVTKNIRREMNENDDWNLLIVHYLGLDHLGHSLGSFHPFVQHKLEEYDRIIQEIVEKLRENDLLIVTGDHGMIDQGGHGGSSNKEILVPLVFISKRFQHQSNSFVKEEERREYYQIDLTSTLSGLFQIGIPSNNLGIQIESILRKYFYREKNEFFRCLFDDNQRQLIDVLHSSSSFSSSSSSLSSIESIRNEAIRSSQEQNLLYICLSLSIFILSLIDLSLNEIDRCRRKDLLIYLILLIIMEMLFNEIRLNLSLLIIGYFLHRIVLEGEKVRKIFSSLSIKRVELRRRSCRMDLSIRLIHLICLFSSSYIEEEHQFFFYFLSTWILFRFIEEKSIQFVVQLILLRLLRQWNQTGNKYLNQPDIKSFLHHSSISMLTIKIFYFYLLFEMIRNVRKNWKEIFFVLLLLIHRRHQTFLLLIYYLFSLFNDPNNDFLFYFFSQSAFFHLGNSNSLVTIDISTGFVGFVSYHPILHGLLIYLGIYLLSMIFFLEMKEEIRLEVVEQQIIENVLYVICLFLHRNHLFIWTVFAPKLFYQFTQTFNYLLFSIISTTKLFQRK